MKSWWQNLSARERQLVTLGTLVVAAFLLYRLGWLALIDRGARLEARVADDYRTLAWMRQASAQLADLKGADAAPTEAVNPLLAIQETAAQLGLDKQMTHLDAQGGNGIQVRLENAPLDTMLGWMQTLGRRYGLAIERVVIEPQPAQVNRVNATLVISPG